MVGAREPVLLERADALAVLAVALDAVRARSRGRLVLVSGEAGIGKSALVRAFCGNAASVRVLWGGCDALHTPRALGPFADIATEAGRELDDVVSAGAAPAAVVAALAGELRRALAIVVLEDLHWADEATLDALRLAARRIDDMPALVLATYRDDGLAHDHPLRIVLGELPTRGMDRIALEPLSAAAVGVLADATGLDHAALHARTAGNPFFVTEVVAAAGAGLPDTVRDAVLARAARLSNQARVVLDAAAIEPARAELWLLEAVAGGELTGLDACLASGMLRADRGAVSFRHEIARVTVEEALAPHKRVLLHRRALAALTAASGRRPDLARLADHAEAADDGEAVLRYAPAAGERAAALGSHREAAAQFARALRYAAPAPEPVRAGLLERRSYECYLIDRMPEALAARREAMDVHRAAGDRRREGDAHRWLSRLAWFSSDNPMAEGEARLAVEILQVLEPGPELAMALSNMAQLRMLASEPDAAIVWGGRAIALAEAIDDADSLVHALNNVGTAELMTGAASGWAKVERSLALALDAGFDEHAVRAYSNLGSYAVDISDYPRADRYLDAGIGYCDERDLDPWLLYMTGHRARSQLDQGRWDAAAASAEAVLVRRQIAAPSRIVALVVIGRLHARRGVRDPWGALDEALELAQRSGELQRAGLVAVARAEARWLAGDNAAVDGETAATLARALEHGELWHAGELATWRRRAGLGITSTTAAEPWRLELEGRAEDAAARWDALGCPFHAALARAHSDSEAEQRRALAALQRLGARPAAGRVARRLRERGARDVRHGPHAATRANPAGLTARELEVLALVAQGLRNAEIAARLFVSERTVAHHVSAILRKLGVGTRGQAGAEAARLGIIER